MDRPSSVRPSFSPIRHLNPFYYGGGESGLHGSFPANLTHPSIPTFVNSLGSNDAVRGRVNFSSSLLVTPPPDRPEMLTQKSGHHHYSNSSHPIQHHPIPHGCQMAIAGFLDCMRLALQACRTMAPLRHTARFNPFPRLAQSKERKGSNFAAQRSGAIVLQAQA